MKIVSVLMLVIISLILISYFAFYIGEKIKTIRKYRSQVKEIKGTDLTTKEKYTFVKFQDAFSKLEKQQEKPKTEKK